MGPFRKQNTISNISDQKKKKRDKKQTNKQTNKKEQQIYKSPKTLKLLRCTSN